MGAVFSIPPQEFSPILGTSLLYFQAQAQGVLITETELKLMAAAASIGLNRTPKRG